MSFAGAPEPMPVEALSGERGRVLLASDGITEERALLPAGGAVLLAFDP